MSENVARVTSKADVSHDDKLTNELNHLSYGVHALSSSNNFCWRKLRSYRTAVFWCLLSTAGASSIEYASGLKTGKAPLICEGTTTPPQTLSYPMSASLHELESQTWEQDTPVPSTRDTWKYGQVCSRLDKREPLLIAGVYSAGFLLVSSVSWLLLDRFGRKAGLLSAQVLLATSIISQMVTRNWSAWMIARLLAVSAWSTS